MGYIHLDYYATLNVTPQASHEDIKRAYRALALRHHPDRNQGDRAAEEKIREINAAYEILGNQETRQSYERLRFGGHGRNTDFPADPPADTPSPAVILEHMERTLREEGQREIFRILMADLPRVKQELADIRGVTVAELGYDVFREAIVKRRAAAVMAGLVTPAMEERKTSLLGVAVQMMHAQGIAGGHRDDPERLARHLDASFHRGRLDGYCDACKLLHIRR